MKLENFSRLGEMSLVWVKLKIVYRQGEWFGETDKNFYRLGEMPGGFGENSYNQL